MKTKLQKLQKQLKKINNNIIHSQNIITELTQDYGNQNHYSFWNPQGAQARVDVLLAQRDAIQQQITNIQHQQTNCSIL